MKSRKYFWQTFAALFGLSVCSAFAFYIIAPKDPVLIRTLLILLPIQIVLSGVLAYRLQRPFDVLRFAMQRIRQQLRHRIQMLSAQRNEQDALLSSMAEGVVAVDGELRVIQINRAAARILHLNSKSAIGRTLYDVITEPAVIDLVETVRLKNQTAEQDIELKGDRTRHLQVQAGPMHADSKAVGVVLVFSDVTRIRELEGMRRNFVSNVSHELRTPLTSIQGFAETLLNPAVKDPEEIRKFLQIIQRHATRLGRIIDDILTLSSLERDAESNQIELKVEFIRGALQSAVEICGKKAENKKIKIELECPENISAAIDTHLLEQAVINLVDNAVRYSDEGQPIRVEGVQVGNDVQIRVIDHGIGIPEKQLPRIFERFYRVDKARSRELGGTGLGLSIVKHISLAHKGSVDVKSEVGRGSQFTIHLPAASSIET